MQNIDIKFKNLILMLAGLLSAGGFFFYLYIQTHFSYYAHLSAIFIEISFSLIIIEVYLEYNKKKESFRVYSLARNYIFSRIFLHFNKILFKNFKNTEKLCELGKRPSFDKRLEKQDMFKKLSKNILENMTTEDTNQIKKIIKKEFGSIEKLYNLNIVYHNQDLFSSISKFVDLCYYIKEHEQDTNSKQLQGIAYKKFQHLIKTWLYIINNFIYFTNQSLDCKIRDSLEKGNIDILTREID